MCVCKHPSRCHKTCTHIYDCVCGSAVKEIYHIFSNGGGGGRAEVAGNMNEYVYTQQTAVQTVARAKRRDDVRNIRGAEAAAQQQQQQQHNIFMYIHSTNGPMCLFYNLVSVNRDCAVRTWALCACACAVFGCVVRGVFQGIPKWELSS